MSSSIIKGHVGLSHTGNIYNCLINSHTVLADSESELFDQIGKVIEPEYLEPFDVNGFTWTFVRDDSAADYNVARKHPEHRPSASKTTTYGISSGMFASHSSYIVYPCEAAYEAADWIYANCKGRVLAWTLPCTEQHFYMFEDAKEAMLFRLALS